MTAEELAEVHARCFPERPWRADELNALLNSPNTLALAAKSKAGFAIAQTVADEAELLTIAVHPAEQRRGTASELLASLMLALAETGTASLLLDVAEDNIPARALYAKLGFTELARRKAYYRRTGAEPVDALVLKRNLTEIGSIPHGTALRIG